MSKKKDASMLVSALGVLMGIITALVAAVKKKGGSDEDFYRLVTPEGENLIEKIADMIVQAGLKPKNIFRVLINYDRSVADGIKAGNYDWENDDITSEHFPSQETGIKEVEITLFHYDKDMSTDEVMADLDKQGFRPATLKELLALGEKHPDLQREFPIIAFGSVWRRLGDRRCPYLFRGGPGRYLTLGWVDDRWNGGCRFAAVRK